VVPWLQTGESDDQSDDDDQDVVDTSSLYGDDTIIESGVTSGADPSAWDPIGIDRRPDSPGNSGEGGKPNH